MGFLFPPIFIRQGIKAHHIFCQRKIVQVGVTNQNKQDFSNFLKKKITEMGNGNVLFSGKSRKITEITEMERNKFH
jgi:hypothetical protein